MFTAHLKNPPGEVYAFIHKRLENQVMGLAIDSQTGDPIEAVILPTRQRVMLALGVGNEDANIHHKYRRKYRHGYTVTWISDSKSDPRLAKFRGEPEVSSKAGDPSQPRLPSAEHPATPPERVSVPAGEPNATVELMRAGMEQGRAKELPTQETSPTTPQPQIDKDNASKQEPTQGKPKEVVDMFGGV